MLSHGPFCYCELCTREDLENALKTERQVTTILVWLAAFYLFLLGWAS